MVVGCSEESLGTNTPNAIALRQGHPEERHQIEEPAVLMDDAHAAGPHQGVCTLSRLSTLKSS